MRNCQAFTCPFHELERVHNSVAESGRFLCTGNLVLCCLANVHMAYRESFEQGVLSLPINAGSSDRIFVLSNTVQLNARTLSGYRQSGTHREFKDLPWQLSLFLVSSVTS